MCAIEQSRCAHTHHWAIILGLYCTSTARCQNCVNSPPPLTGASLQPLLSAWGELQFLKVFGLKGERQKCFSSEFLELPTQKRRNTEAGRKVSHLGKVLDWWDPPAKFYRIPPRHINTSSSKVLKVEHGGYSRRDGHYWLVIQRWPQELRASWCPLFGWVLLFLRLWRS